MSFRIVLFDKSADVVKYWNEFFEDHPAVARTQGDIFTADSDAIVTPTNSFGFMESGLDYQMTKFFGREIEDKVRAAIRQYHGGELIIGAAQVVPTGHPKFRHLVAAPTMRVPEDVSSTVNCYLAFRGTLLAVRAWNEAHPGSIGTLAVSGLATGNGSLAARLCGKQMRAAYDHVMGGKVYEYPYIGDAIQEHEELLAETV
ncbi:MAG: macro domain-containing protein [Planctomycetes bacterium]|nr:macro domain-containing protein [Planctomycetota bacterium]MBI3843337.1 macro domain-containing protein [Planctomycetota bacterium]